MHGVKTGYLLSFIDVFPITIKKFIMTRLRILLIILSLFMISSCTDEKSPQTDEKLPQKEGLQTSLCTDLSGEAISYTIFPSTFELWGNNFLQVYKVTPDTTLFALDMLSVELKNCMDSTGGNSPYDGLKAYIGLDSTVSTIEEIHDHLCLILAPYRMQSGTSYDTVFYGNCGPFKMIGTDTTTSVSLSVAQTYIDNWQDHYSYDDSIMVPVSAFMISSSTINNTIQRSMSAGNDHRIHMVFGYYALDPTDSIHCIENAQARQNSSNNNTYGYGAITLMVSSKLNGNNGTFSHSDNFLRPCPRFCGASLFQLDYN